MLRRSSKSVATAASEAQRRPAAPRRAWLCPAVGRARAGSGTYFGSGIDLPVRSRKLMLLKPLS